MTSQEIIKLQKLFPINADTVTNFQLQPLHEHVIWNQTPVNVTLPVGKERMVSFPGSVQFGYDKSILGDDILQVQNNAGTLYLKAKKSFPIQRVEVKLNDSGQIILLNLAAQSAADVTPLDVVIAQPNTQTIAGDLSTKTNFDSDNTLNSELSNNPVSYVTLTRFAAQQLYALKRLLVQPPNIFRTPMHTHKTAPLFLDGSVIAQPLASWRGGDLFVTAVLLRNQLKQPLVLDPRNLCGSWQAASFFPISKLEPIGAMTDSTTLFLVSNRPFAESMATCLRGF